jgi:amino acid permease
MLEGNAISSIFQIPRRLSSPVNLCEGRRYFFPFFNDVLNSNNQPYSITDFFRVFPIFLFSYTCHQNTFNIINELERPTPSRINSVFILTMIFCMTLYLIIAVSAYLTFGDLITSDILYSYPGKKEIMFLLYCSFVTLSSS